MKNTKEILSNIFLFENISDTIINKCCSFDGCNIVEYLSGDIMQDFKSEQNIGILLNGKASIISGDDGVIIRGSKDF